MIVDESLVDMIAWGKTCLLITAATVPGSLERAAELAKLREAIIEPRRRVDETLAAGGGVPPALLVELRVCEKAVPALEKGAVLRR
jgi:hypothetical protein